MNPEYEKTAYADMLTLMRNLLDAGFERRDVLARGYDLFLQQFGAYANTKLHLKASEMVLKAAKELHMDHHSQYVGYLKALGRRTALDAVLEEELAHEQK